MFNGKRPETASVEARRKINVEEHYKEKLPEDYKKLESLISSGCTLKEEYFTHGKKELATTALVPSPEKSNGKGFLFCHGYTDSTRWIQRHVFLRYCDHGYTVIGVEIEGHGLSTGKLGHIQSMDDALDSISEFFTSEKEKYPDVKKWFVHGESMGGMCAINMGLRHPDLIDGMVLVAPMCKIAQNVQPNFIVLKLLVGLSKVIGSWSITPSDFDAKLVFKNQETAKLDESDPLKYVGNPRLSTARELLSSTNKLTKKILDITVPFIVLHGKKDVVTDSEASEELFNMSAKVKPEDKKLVLPEDGWHSLLWGEPEEKREEYWKEILDWVESRA
eukprot:augustus_masked-scaffold_3-processed-gene-2.55-mRNA-1 protein AED:1.00 eAED:1.00 QI:0/-1/0/0/-1/1/1/0/332